MKENGQKVQMLLQLHMACLYLGIPLDHSGLLVPLWTLQHLCKIPTVLISVPSVVPGSSHVMGQCNGMYTALLVLVVQQVEQTCFSE